MFIISAIGSIIGFLITYRLLQSLERRSRFWKHNYMIHAMALGYIFPMMVDIAIKNYILAYLLPMTIICAPIFLGIKNLKLHEKLEISISTLMSVTMSVMMIGMTQGLALITILFMLILIDSGLWVTVLREEK